jgi:hypothetical protein
LSHDDPLIIKLTRNKCLDLQNAVWHSADLFFRGHYRSKDTPRRFSCQAFRDILFIDKYVEGGPLYFSGRGGIKASFPL